MLSWIHWKYMMLFVVGGGWKGRTSLCQTIQKQTGFRESFSQYPVSRMFAYSVKIFMESIKKKKKKGLKKQVYSEDGETTSKKSSVSDGRQFYREQRLWELLLQLIITFSPAGPCSSPSPLSSSYFAELKLRVTQMLAKDNTVFTALVLGCASAY